MAKIPFFDSKCVRGILNSLEDEQSQKMALYVTSKLEIETNEMDIQTWLKILTVGQGQNLLNSLVLKKKLSKVLEYLLKKNGQWT